MVLYLCASKFMLIDEILTLVMQNELTNRFTFHIIVYQKGDIVKDPMKSISFVPKTIPGVGVGWMVWGRVGWDMSCRLE